MFMPLFSQNLDGAHISISGYYYTSLKQRNISCTNPTTKKTVVPTPVFDFWSPLSKVGRPAASRFLLCAFPFEYIVADLTLFFFSAREEDMPRWHHRFCVCLHALGIHKLRHGMHDVRLPFPLHLHHV
jgi:hypothetical protein